MSAGQTDSGHAAIAYPGFGLDAGGVWSDTRNRVMPMDAAVKRRVVRFAVLAQGIMSGAVGAQCPPAWARTGPVFGRTGGVGQIIEFDPDGPGPQTAHVIASGDFFLADGRPVGNIAAWDGSAWLPLGEGLDGPVRRMTVWNNKLVVIGAFTRAGTAAAPGIASWDGTVWSPLPSPAPGHVALASFNEKLYCLAYSSVFEWDGVLWRQRPPYCGWVDVLAVHNGSLYAANGGQGWGEPICLTRFDGNVWHPEVPGLASWSQFPSIYFLGEAAGRLYITNDTGSYRREGSAWVQIDSGYVLDATDLGGEPIMAGLLHVGSSYCSVARWTPQGWDPLVTPGPWGTLPTVRALGAVGGRLFAGGAFLRIEGTPCGSVASWSPLGWEAVGRGVDLASGAAVYAVTVDGADIWVGGSFDTVSGIKSGSIARWDGWAWRTPGGGMSVSSAFPPLVNAITRFRGEIVAAGVFTAAGGTPAQNIASWDGKAWRPLGAGVPGRNGEGVYAMAEYNGELIVGGSIGGAGPPEWLMRWDGQSWSGLGAGVGGRVFALAVHNNELIVGGNFDTAGGVPTRGLARWDGAAWRSLGFVNGGVLAISEYGGDLIIGGSFTLAGATGRSVARWDGAAWTPLGAGVATVGGAGAVRALAAHGGSLYATGTFDFAGGLPAANIARWDGASWSAVDGGLGKPASTPMGRALKSLGTDLLVGGDFATAGGVTSPALARWGPGAPECVANCDCSTLAPVLNVADFVCFLSRFGTGDPLANCDRSVVPPVLNVADFVCFMSAYARGCP